MWLYDYGRLVFVMSLSGVLDKLEEAVSWGVHSFQRASDMSSMPSTVEWIRDDRSKHLLCNNRMTCYGEFKRSRTVFPITGDSRFSDTSSL